jgi:hypothetical protein
MRRSLKAIGAVDTAKQLAFRRLTRTSDARFMTDTRRRHPCGYTLAWVISAVVCEGEDSCLSNGGGASRVDCPDVHTDVSTFTLTQGVS